MVPSPHDWESLRRAYIAKNEAICSYGWLYTDALDFYRDVFPAGFLQDEGKADGDGRPNAIALEVCGPSGLGDGRMSVRRHTLTDGLPQLEGIREHSSAVNSFCFMSPISYFGRNRTAANARYLHALAIDLDGVGEEQCDRVVRWMGNGAIRVPANYIVNSGTGLHIYYVLDVPIPLVPGNVPGLQLLKRRVTERVWTEDTSLHESIQYQGVYQGFRVPNTPTKLNGAPGTVKVKDGYEAVCWRNPERSRTSLEQLLGMVPDAGKHSQLAELREVMATAGRTPLEIARKKWPEWYERRIVQGQERGSYVVKRDLYDWWLERIRHERTIHHRYWCVFALASYANKCGITREELEEDAFSLVEDFQSLDTPDNPFTEEDVLSALDAFEEGRADGRSRRYTRAFLERKTAISMPARKRNGQKRVDHLEETRAIRDIRQRRSGTNWWDNGGRPKGSKNKSYPKRDAILKYAAEHPDANHSEIARAVGVSRPTVIKWLGRNGDSG